jgi:hypothetical protein
MLCMATKGFLFCLTLSYKRTALCKARYTLSVFVQPACTAYLHTSKHNRSLKVAVRGPVYGPPLTYIHTSRCSNLEL